METSVVSCVTLIETTDNTFHVICMDTNRGFIINFQIAYQNVLATTTTDNFIDII